MSQTQILLLVLISILVGIAVIMAVNIFTENAASANLDRVTAFLVVLGAKSQKHYRVPAWLGGGGHSFYKLTANAQGIAFLTNIPETIIGTFSILIAGTDSKVTLQGIGVEDGDSMHTVVLNR